MEAPLDHPHPSISGTIIFSTVGRSDYGFDIFSLPLDNFSSATELRLTDGISVNFNGQFTDDDRSLVFISERSGSPQVYLTRPEPDKQPKQLPSAPGSLFHDRPTLHNNRLFFVSAHQPPDSLYKSWSAIYSLSLDNDDNHNHEINRLTPNGAAEFSPSISQSGNYLAVASYGTKPWGGEFHELNTRVVVYDLTKPTEPIVVSDHGGWPTWSGDSTIYFHRQSDDGWWSIYEVGFPTTGSHVDPPRRITPPGVHAFTPAAIHHSNKIVVATRRKGKIYRHIEILDVGSGEFYPVTELVNPEFHHYNPFVSPGSKFIGYHRFRGKSNNEHNKSIIPNLEPVLSPFKSLTMLRINGSFPSFSEDGKFVAFNPELESNGGGVKIMRSDGSKRWTLIKGHVAFYNSWGPSLLDKKRHVIYTSLGPIFQPAQATVQVARISFDVDNVEVKIMTKEETGNNGFPACSPDGKLVVFRSGRSGHKNLYIMDAVDGEVDGGDSARQLTEGPWIDTMPNWSPDGELIAFSSNRHDPSNPVTFGLYLVRPDGSGLRRVHMEGSSGVSMERINHVCFSPNGEWLLFTTNMSAVTAEPVSFPNQFQPYGDLFIAKVDGSGLRRLTWNGYENGTPTWHSHQEVGVDIGHLALNEEEEVDGDELKGQFQEPLWITCEN
ncbi:Tol-Pal system protein TolB [Bienertia sinuspersici]